MDKPLNHKDHFKTFYKKHFVNMVKYCALRVENEETAEEIVQSAFVKLWQKKQHNISNPASYLFQIVINEIKNHYRSHKRVKTEFLENEIIDPEISPAKENRDLKTTLDKAISHLPEKCKHIILMSYFEGLTKPEIASYLNISEETVKKQRQIGLKKLRNFLIQ